MNTSHTSSRLSAPIANTPTHWLSLLCLLLGVTLLALSFSDGLYNMMTKWNREEYSHGYMIPLVSLFLIAQKATELGRLRLEGSWLGVSCTLLGFILLILGELSSLYTIIHYGFLVAFTGFLMAAAGLRSVTVIWPALAYLIFMIPLPNFLYFNLSSQLQLLSSSIGVAVIRLFDISVFLEGNVIDLGSYQLQVVEACSGLRYLFPLMSFGFLIAYLYQAPVWQRAIIFLSTIPITVFMNSFRIAVIGITVNYWGIQAAEGFLHDFEGWVVFMSCLGILALEIALLHKLTRGRGNVIERMNLSLPEAVLGKLSAISPPRLTQPFIVCLLLMAAGLATVYSLGERQEHKPERLSLTFLPLFKGGWVGREGHLDDAVQQTLKVTDYMIADYTHRDGGLPVNFYIAYYDSQRKGASIHSPRSCIPGGGWQITALDRVQLTAINDHNNTPLTVNRAVIEKGDARSLTYYWFQQRGRVITNELLAKWFIFWDGLTINRTDGALVRVVVQVPETMSLGEADQHLTQFLQEFHPLLTDYIPN